MGAAGLPALGWAQQFRHSADIKIFGSNMALHGTHKAFSFQCFAANGRGFGADSTNKRKIKSKRRPKDVVVEPSKLYFSICGHSLFLGVPELRTGSENRSGKQVMDKQFLQKVEAVRRSALEKKKAEENKDYQAIDYDAPIESDKSTIGFGTRVGIGVAVVVFGLVFAFGDFLPYGSVSPSKESAVVKQKLSQEEEAKFKSELQGFEATLSKSTNDPTALEGAAVSLVELGEYEKASMFLEKLVKVIPDKAEAYRLLGEVKFELKDYEGSSSSYRSALSSSDNIDFEVLRGLTNALLAAKKPDQAVDIILSCRQKLNEKSQTRLADLEAANDNGVQKPQDIDPIQVDLLLGKAYSDWGHISDAVSVYDKLINEHPEDFRGYLAKGIILKENGKSGDAERMFIQAKFFAPEAAKALIDRYAQR
ncbi:uncharacterized protein LOC120659841 isoform X2 [Panicum virgatum]|uniref:Tetratricopeptide repeat (TPR)-like superfamily protein n=1 Tax=Panicum virgatum TaxID=38727 RepID=A0A8T0VCP7_PANVG|nr:uncharacterized protein LOC120659841 isoform X2 [Panicum virgatum]KAG2632990.1 hypothetical protein PVAP13_2NG291603 [Panicum virgatum]